MRDNAMTRTRAPLNLAGAASNSWIDTSETGALATGGNGSLERQLLTAANANGIAISLRALMGYVLVPA